MSLSQVKARKCTPLSVRVGYHARRENSGKASIWMVLFMSFIPEADLKVIVLETCSSFRSPCEGLWELCTRVPCLPTQPVSAPSCLTNVSCYIPFVISPQAYLSNPGCVWDASFAKAHGRTNVLPLNLLNFSSLLNGLCALLDNIAAFVICNMLKPLTAKLLTFVIKVITIAGCYPNVHSLVFTSVKN